MSIATVSTLDIWKRQGVILALSLILLFALYYSTFESMVSIWLRSDTFAHGFIILPISLWLIWRIREQLIATEPKVNYLGIVLLLGAGAVWLLANYVGVLVIEQLAAVMMIPALVFTLLGWGTTVAMLFPLFFLFFAVPLGEELTPYLIDFTADFTVALIKLTGIPIYREGNFFQLPTGNWSVVAACSGVRYLIASVTLGVLYAYLTYQSPLKRTVFVLFSFIVPIIANGFRAFMIVMIGHFSDMQLATGVDHLVYGWVFFGIVIAIMFYIGSFWRDEEVIVAKSGVNLKLGNLSSELNSARIVMLLAGLIMIVWPIKVQLEQQAFSLDGVAQIDVAAPKGWTQGAAGIGWKPAYQGLDRQFSGIYKNAAGEEVELFIGYYAEQRQGAELGNFNNVLVTEQDEIWRVVGSRASGVALAAEGIRVPLAVLSSKQSRLVSAYFYYVDGEIVTSKYQTKLLQIKAKLMGGRNDGAVIALNTETRDNDAPAVALLERFAAEALPGIKASLDDVGRAR